MRLGWDEIKRRAKVFSEEWKDAHYEKGETQTFYNEFFELFGIRRKQVAIYEQRVKLLKQKHGFIDLFWPGTLLVEQKSANLDLDRAQGQALDYVQGVHPTDQPRWVLTCDFQRWRLLDLETGRELKFHLQDLHKHITAFDFMLGRKVSFETQAGVTIKAAELMGKLHDALEESGYVGHDLEQLLVRLLFCLFADDTGIFQPKDIFLQLIENDTRPDGSNVGRVLSDLFDVLDTPENARQTTLQAELDAFPYVNGQLFGGRLRTAHFDATMREHLLDAARHDWSGVSPAIFGSLFQSVMDAEQRRAKGAHYTTEANILKVIGPLFLDDLKAELASIIARKTAREKELAKFQDKLTRLTFFDPACGCGNFLVIAYREIRRLELECLKAQYGDQQIDAALLSRVTVGQFYGIEFEEFPARIAEVAMWMMDHIANNEINEAFRLNYARIPLKDSAHILHGDALETDWNTLLRAERCSYIMGNPPFLGAKQQDEFQRLQVRRIAALGGSGGTLDYVAAWFIKAGQYCQANKRIQIAFVATNSITQGEQVAQLWPVLYDRHCLEIAFAHRTFAWASEARGKAHVHVVIVGLSHRDHEPSEKRLFSYPDLQGDPVESQHKALTAYLFDARGLANRHLVVKSVSTPINGAPKLQVGSKPVDGGYFIFSPAERSALIEAAPGAERILRPFIGAEEFLNGGIRHIIDVEKITPKDINAYPPIRERISKVRKWRLGEIAKKNSKKGTDRAAASTRPLAQYPTKFHVNVFPASGFLVVPENGSERREYVPAGWLTSPIIPSSLVRIALDAEIWHFAVLASRMHMAWVNHIGGRLKSDPRYSIGLVYNTFPWPDMSEAQRARIEALAQDVLSAREAHPTSSLATLYDPDTMPADLRKAHTALDAAVDKLYRPTPFASDRDRVEHLFGRYEALVNPLERVGVAKNKRVARRSGK
ncbi:N-6 DNA methylase [Erythrobacter westpacificensis]|uniref:site-specific DNA-methyltransferase (adenine-specific) n=1 Tax=Erythrobacter westpacificensis TaxID=1055231 RepID=A0ABP9K206_9SPHN